MKIWLAGFLIAGGERESPSGFLVDQDRLTQSVDYVGAEWGSTLALGQRRNTIQFTVARLHSTPEIAEQYELEHPDLVPTKGTLQIETSNGRLRRWIQNAVCSRVSCVERVGLHSRWAYTITGGAMLSVNPDTIS